MRTRFGFFLALAACNPDRDHDGYPSSIDCNDEEPQIWPFSPETCNGLDDDCNGIVDDDPSDAEAYIDADGDGYGDRFADAVCSGEETVHNDDDCDDQDGEVNPDADDDDLIDRNCDGQVGPEVPFGVELTWDQSGLDIEITGTSWSDMYGFGIARTDGEDRWDEEDCLGYDWYCHYLEDTSTRLWTSQSSYLYYDETHFGIDDAPYLTYQFWLTTDPYGPCLVWGHDPAYYDDVIDYYNCTVIYE